MALTHAMPSALTGLTASETACTPSTPWRLKAPTVAEIATDIPKPIATSQYTHEKARRVVT